MTRYSGDKTRGEPDWTPLSTEARIVQDVRVYLRKLNVPEARITDDEILTRVRHAFRVSEWSKRDD